MYTHSMETIYLSIRAQSPVSSESEQLNSTYGFPASLGNPRTDPSLRISYVFLGPYKGGFSLELNK